MGDHFLLQGIFPTQGSKLGLPHCRWILYQLGHQGCPFDCVDHNKRWKILQEMGISVHLPCLLRKLYAGQEATVRIRHGTTDWFQIGKEVHQGCVLSPCLFNLYAEHTIQNAGLDEAQLDSRLPGEISVTSDMQMTSPLWQKEKSN